MNITSDVINEEHFHDPRFMSTVRGIHSMLGVGEAYNNVSSGLGGIHINGTKHWEYSWILLQLAEVIKPLQVVLDAGAGRGALQFFLERQYNLSVHSVDLDIRSSTLNELMGTNIRFSQGDLEHLEFNDATFDGIFCISVLEHLKDPIKVVKELSRVLKPSGYVGLTFDWVGNAPFNKENLFGILKECGFLFNAKALLEVTEEEALRRGRFVLDKDPGYSVAAMTLTKV